MNHRTAPPSAEVGGVYAADLRATVATDPTAPVLAAIQGAGGFGKSALLAELTRVYRAAGVPVLDTPQRARPDAAVLIDDAHLLDDSALRALRELAGDNDARLIVAYRPWPRSAELNELVTLLGRGNPPVVLGTLDVADLVRRVAAPREWVEWLCQQTGGVPRFLERVLTTLGQQDVGWPGIPRVALQQFHHDLDLVGGQARATLAAMALGAAPHPELLASVLGLDAQATDEALCALRAAGLLDTNDLPLPIARQAMILLMPWEHRVRITRRLVDIQLRRGGPVLPLVRPLLDGSMSPESGLAPAFLKAGEEALGTDPPLAAKLLDAAVAAGAPAAEVTARRAQTAAASGDLDEALRLADQVIADEHAPNRALGVQVAAAVLAHRGLLSRCAELCAWSARQVRWPGDSAFAAAGLTAVGRLSEAESLLSPSDAGPPTSLTGSASQLAEGLRESVTGSAITALSTLVRSASLAEPLGSSVLMPETPAAVAAIVASHCGEFDVAESLLTRAIDTGAGGPLMRTRHRLLAAWLPLVAGDTVAAKEQLEAVQVTAARDRLLATAIEAGIANRDNDTTALSAVRPRLRTAVAEHPVDLFALLPLGELVFAAARLRDQDWLVPYLQEARTLLFSLGNPPLWSALLTWKCLQAAIVLDDTDAVRRHANELHGMAEHNPMSSAMAEASAVWLRILDGKVEQAEAEKAARTLHAAGLAWDGARLAGQAAIRTTDRTAMVALLECARSLQGKGPRPRAVGTGGSTDLLSDREKEVAELVLSGLTYKQVGKRLFISAKTVEHHIGRIKQRLGCTSREELLNRLRELLDR